MTRKNRRTMDFIETLKDGDKIKLADAIEWADKTMVEKACEWITEHIDIPYEGGYVGDSPIASDYIEWCEKRLEYAMAVADAFKQAMEE